MEIRIIIAGDFCPNSRVKTEIAEGRGKEVLRDVKQLTNRADISILNFECPITNGNYSPIAKIGPNLKSDPDAMEIVKDAGFDLVTLANNHILDYGEEGVKDTIKQCEKCDLTYVGAGLNLKDACTTKYISVKGKTIAFINCCEHEFSIATEETAGANPLNPINQFYAIREAKSKSDYVVVIVHGGHELCQYPSFRMIETYRFFVDSGADAVVNHHQHCYSGYEFYNGHPIVYGVGNFCFDWDGRRNSIWNEGYIAEIIFNESKPILNCHPYNQCDETPRVSLIASSDAFMSSLHSLNGVISNPVKLKEKMESFYKKRKSSILFAFEPYSGKVATKLFALRLLPSFFNLKKKRQIKNYISCESHSDILNFILNH